MNIEELHKKILYPVVRIRTEKAGGSCYSPGSLSLEDKNGNWRAFSYNTRSLASVRNTGMGIAEYSRHCSLGSIC